MTAVRIALIGAGVMGRQHAQYIQQLPETTLVAIADPFTQALATDYGVPAFTDHRQMLEHIRPDAVIIANPNHLHVSTATDCLQAGIPTLLEKPVATSLAEAFELVAVEQRTGVPLLIGHHRRHNPIVTRAKSIIDSGALGRLTTVTALWQVRKDDAYFDVAWRREPGAGVLLINLIHDLDLLRHLCGEVSQVQAITSHGARQLAVEDSAALLLQFANGALGTLTGSDATVAPWGWDQNSGENPSVFAQQADQPCYLLAGTEGSLSIPQLKLWRYGEQQGWHHPLLCQQHAPADSLAMHNQLRHLVQLARGECAPLVSAADAAKTLALVEAAQRAARDGFAAQPAAE
ncbi:MAG: Gfo/Idh/MocA family oxidoreductase [Pseudomonas sp.]|nr:Gfo/Idh/MocA family oxidoreductase [Pseudomonas sp.]